MRAFILNGEVAPNRTVQAVREMASDYLRGRDWVVDSLALCEMKVAPCVGCFGCWLKTPGVCVIDDEGRDIAKAIIQSDLLILLTPVTFGGYSSELKKALDRMIPLISPYFMKVNGEIHHRPRYEKFPDLVGIGVIPSRDDESERIFRTLVRRNAINTHSAAYAAEIIIENQNGRAIENAMQGLFSRMEVAQ
jgi:hypothetical protein